jgi:predicted MFS family arabinose efflux permease
MAALGGGAVLGALSVASAGLERPSAAMVVTAAVVTSAGVLALGFSRSFGLTAAILVVTGAAQIVFTSSANSTIQVTVPDGMRGRMMSFYVLVFVGVTPAGAFLVGLIAEHFGVSRACALGGAAGLLSVAAVTMTWRATARRT